MAKHSDKTQKALKEQIPSCVRPSEKGIFLSIKVKPRASKSVIKGLQGDFLKIDIKAPPVDGQANKELIRFLSKKLKISKQDIEIKSGKSSKEKLVLLKDISFSDISSQLF